MPRTVLVSRLGKGGGGGQKQVKSLVFKNIVKKTKQNRTLTTTTKLSGSPECISQARKQDHVTKGRVLVQGLQEQENWPRV